jgi:hypothetical protein
MQPLAQSEHLAFFVCWLALALVVGFTLFYVWDLLHRRWERKNARGEASIAESEHGQTRRD